jgi:uncharacterized protein
MGLFLITVLGIWAGMHIYVFWRLTSIPFVAAHISHLTLVVSGVLLWSSYALARILDSKGLQSIAWPIEYLAANWIGLLFLLFAALLVTEVVTFGGWLLVKQAPAIRSWAVAGACMLAVFGFLQALRPPVVKDYEVALSGLPPERDGTTLIAVSDLHLGNLLGRRWLKDLTQRLNTMNPDLVLVLGDLVDGNVGSVEPLREILQGLKAPLGVYAVTGNHEFYAGLERSVRLFEESGFQVLRDRNVQIAPGLILAGVDDLTARQQFGKADNAIEKALGNRPAGGVILLSHSPLQPERAARAGAGLMLSGHTHNGQIWPFKYLVSLRYPLVAGRYQVDGMAAIVCRGTGTWGPRMRLWRPSELVRITLRCSSPGRDERKYAKTQSDTA